jgi:hypothetical protein
MFVSELPIPDVSVLIFYEDLWYYDSLGGIQIVRARLFWNNEMRLRSHATVLDKIRQLK